MFTTPISDLTDRRDPHLEGEIPALSAEILGISLVDEAAPAADLDVA